MNVLSRLTVFLAFILLTAAAASLHLLATASISPENADLAGKETHMLSSARLHSEVVPPSLPAEAAFCTECHASPPHEGEGSDPAFNNEHAHTMDCLLCHWSSLNGDRPRAVHVRRAGAGPSEERRAFIRLEAVGAGDRTQASLREEVLRSRVCFERGPSCKECHHPGGMSTLLPPGMPAAAQEALEKLPYFFTLPGKEKWYFPQVR